MAKVQALRCDRCTLVFEDYPNRRQLRSYTLRKLEERWDLCPTCLKEFRATFLELDDKK